MTKQEKRVMPGDSLESVLKCCLVKFYKKQIVKATVL